MSFIPKFLPAFAPKLLPAVALAVMMAPAVAYARSAGPAPRPANDVALVQSAQVSQVAERTTNPHYIFSVAPPPNANGAPIPSGG